MKLSVIVPCFNEKETINTVLSSVKESNIEDLEIIVIDDCSIDKTLSLLEKNEILKPCNNSKCKEKPCHDPNYFGSYEDYMRDQRAKTELYNSGANKPLLTNKVIESSL